jgi:two-component system, cell cycle response regulator DivK
MASPFSIEQLTRFRDSARVLERQAASQERALQQLLTTAETSLRVVREALSSAGGLSSESLAIQRGHAQRAGADIVVARQLCLSAREHHLATSRMVTDLGERQARPSGEQSLSHAVLVADDHDDSREWLSMVLHHAGFIVRTASDGLEALLAACELQPTVIVMDLMMPVLDGTEATRLIKACRELKHVKVIAYSAMSSTRVPDPELFSAFLPKPSPPDKIVQSVQNFITA